MKIQDDILSYYQMCAAEKTQMLQRGMNFRLRPTYSVILMSQRSNAPYKDKIYSDGITIEYEGHDVPRHGFNHNPKEEDQIAILSSGKPTQNGLFVRAVEEYKKNNIPELVKVYEKIKIGVWSLKGIFELIDYRVESDGKRSVFKFILRLSNLISIEDGKGAEVEINHTRIIPSEVKMEVWKRDGGQCVICGSKENLHFDHELPFAKGGTSLTAKNVRILCMKHNLEKSSKIQ